MHSDDCIVYRYMTVGGDALKLILHTFTPVIKSNVLSAAPTFGVDISKEERWVRQCYCGRVWCSYTHRQTTTLQTLTLVQYSTLYDSHTHYIYGVADNNFPLHQPSLLVHVANRLTRRTVLQWPGLLFKLWKFHNISQIPLNYEIKFIVNYANNVSLTFCVDRINLYTQKLYPHFLLSSPLY